MTQSTIRPLAGGMRANWIRLRTMIVLRWVAIAGQFAAVTVSVYAFDLNLARGLCYVVIGASVVFNLVASFVYPQNKRLSERENMFAVMFDLMQLGVLLMLTGGLNNPFALLLLGPVTISATALSLRSTLLLCAMAIGLVSILSVAHVPLQTGAGRILALPPLFVFGHWAALVIAIVFTSAYSRRVTTEIHSMSDALAATQMALAREQKLTDLGGVVAAAAHELGTPLATIKLASSELAHELSERADLREDAELIHSQATRCHDILKDMGRAHRDDLHMQQAPLSAVVQEAAEPHTDRGINVAFRTRGAQGPQPAIRRKPEIIHGLRNLIQNAVDFAQSQVDIDIRWSDETLTIRIIDDGPGFPAHLMGRIGDPFMRDRRTRPGPDPRPAYQGMGLGLFIAKTLLERSGAVLRFSNRDGLGAVVEVEWQRTSIDAQRGAVEMSLDSQP